MKKIPVETDDAIVELWIDGSNGQRQIAALLGVSQPYVSKILLARKQKTRNSKTHPAVEGKIIAMAGLPSKQIARAVGCSFNVVARVMRQNGIAMLTKSEARKFCPGPNKGRKFSVASRAKMAAAKRGKKHSPEIVAKRSATMKKRAARGSEHYLWKGGVTPVNKKLRRSREFMEWRKAVFARDDYTCQICGERGGILHPDHIKPFCDYVELRFEVSNGRTLCKECHMKTDTWGINQYRKRKTA